MEDSRIYLLTGAAGFLGNNIARQLVEKGCRVRGLVLKGDKAVKHIPEGVEIVYGDLTDKTSLENFFDVEKEQLVCIHCASIVYLKERGKTCICKFDRNRGRASARGIYERTGKI